MRITTAPRQMEQNQMNKYKKLTIDEVCNELEAPKPTLILFHVRPDGDAVGSAFALKLLLESMGSKSYCICANEIPHRLNFLTKTMQKSALLDSLPEDFCAERIVAVDTASPFQLGELYDRFAGKITLMLDHHSKGEPYADNYILPNRAASGEIVFEISREMLKRGKIAAIPKQLDACLYAAISSDTGCFKYSNVSPETHICTSELMRSGIDTARINQLLFDSKSMEVIAAEKAAMETLKLYHRGKIAVVCFTFAKKKELGVLDEHLETIIDVARSVEGVEVAVAIRQPNEERTFRASTRSSNRVDVSAVCAEFGGGGHVRAAGCTIKADSIEHARDLVVAEIEKQLKN